MWFTFIYLRDYWPSIVRLTARLSVAQETFARSKIFRGAWLRGYRNSSHRAGFFRGVAQEW